MVVMMRFNTKVAGFQTGFIFTEKGKIPKGESFPTT